MNMQVKNQQIANLQGLAFGGQVGGAKQIGAHNGQTVEVATPKPKGPSFFDKVWIAISSVFGFGRASTVKAAPAPPPRSSTPQAPSEVRNAAQVGKSEKLSNSSDIEVEYTNSDEDVQFNAYRNMNYEERKEFAESALNYVGVLKKESPES